MVLFFSWTLRWILQQCYQQESRLYDPKLFGFQPVWDSQLLSRGSWDGVRSNLRESGCGHEIRSLRRLVALLAAASVLHPYQVGVNGSETSGTSLTCACARTDVCFLMYSCFKIESTTQPTSPNPPPPAPSPIPNPQSLTENASPIWCSRSVWGFTTGTGSNQKNNPKQFPN